MKNSRILILGANSDIAIATARMLAQEGADLWLASRDLEELEKEAGNLRTRYGVDAQAIRFDARDWSGHPKFYTGLDLRPDGVVLAFGLLGDQEESQNDFSRAQEVLETNFTGAVSILEIVAADFEARFGPDKTGSGPTTAGSQAGARPKPFIVGISSIAGERGRADNYMYGSSKAGLTAYLSGLRHRMHRVGVSVMTVKPGFVATKMTADKPLPPLLTADPDQVARVIVRGIHRGRNTIYVRWMWRWIMLVIRLLPEGLFKRMGF